MNIVGKYSCSVKVIWGKTSNYTRNGWRRWQNTLEKGGKDGKLHSKRVEKMAKYTRNGC